MREQFARVTGIQIKFPKEGVSLISLGLPQQHPKSNLSLFVSLSAQTRTTTWTTSCNTCSIEPLRSSLCLSQLGAPGWFAMWLKALRGDAILSSGNKKIRDGRQKRVYKTRRLNKSGKIWFQNLLELWSVYIWSCSNFHALAQLGLNYALLCFLGAGDEGRVRKRHRQD